jgi:RNA polymerase sigma-70 factor (ECF subfamily)
VQDLDPEVLVAHTDLLYRAARALCRSQYEAEDLVQETFARVLARPRELRRGNESNYLLRALRNTHANDCRNAARRPQTVAMGESDLETASEIPAVLAAREVIAAIASAPAPYRDAVLAIDLLGLPYDQAARQLGTSTATISSRLARGRQRIARLLAD